MAESLNAKLLSPVGPVGAKPRSEGARAGRYAQDLSGSLSFRENILMTLSVVSPASSVFIIAPSAIKRIGGAAALAFAIAALVGVVVAFCYAELSSAFPIAGGEYSFVARVLGKPYAFALLMLISVGIVTGPCVLATGVEHTKGPQEQHRSRSTA